MVVFVAISLTIAYVQDKYIAKEHIYYRLAQFLVILFVIIVIVALFTHFKFVNLFTSLLAFIPTGWGLILITWVFRPFLQRTPAGEAIISLT